jgi:hypothetical protein
MTGLEIIEPSLARRPIGAARIINQTHPAVSLVVVMGKASAGAFYTIDKTHELVKMQNDDALTSPQAVTLRESTPPLTGGSPYPVGLLKTGTGFVRFAGLQRVLLYNRKTRLALFATVPAGLKNIVHFQ